MFSRPNALSPPSTITCFVLLTATFVNSLTVANFPHKRIDQLIGRFRDATQIPGMAALIVINGEPVYVRPFGLRNHADSKCQVTTDTLFEIGSCTKAFTAYLAATMVREGVIGYEDPVAVYIPEFRLSDAEVTKNIQIKDLLAHASGLPGHNSVWYHANMSRDELLERLPHLPLSYGLREKYQYSNIMYGVAGIAMERATKRSWEDGIRKRIFRPLNMTRSLTSFEEVQKLPSSADVAIPHTTVRGTNIVRSIQALNISMIGPAGSLHSSVNDMAEWIKFQMSETAPKEMHTVKMPYKATVPDRATEEGREVGIGYGYGWLMHLYRGQYVIRHSGQTDGFCAAVSLFPEEKYSIVLLANLDTVGQALRDLVLRVSDIITNRSSSQSDEEWVKGIHNRSHRKSDDEVELNKSVDRAEQFSGQYQNGGYGVIEVSAVGSRLTAVYNNIPYIFIPKVGADFFTLLPQTDARTDGGHERECSFSRDSSGEVIALEVVFEPTVPPILFRKNFPQAQDVQYLGSFVGTFSDAALSVQISLNAEKRLLVAEGAPQYEPVRLVPLKLNWFCIDRCMVKFEFALKSGNVLELYVHQGAEILYTLKRQSA